MNYMQIEKASISNGLGFRVVLYCSGCSLKCEGCFNPETWDCNAGRQFDKTAKEFLFNQLDKPYIKGVTLTGGHPLEDENAEATYLLVKEIKNKFPSKDIWLYTGYTWENIFPNIATCNLTLNTMYKQRIVEMCDVVVDGPYIEEQRDITLAFRGSKNQRLINVKETLKSGKIVTIQN